MHGVDELVRNQSRQRATISHILYFSCPLHKDTLNVFSTPCRGLGSETILWFLCTVSDFADLILSQLLPAPQCKEGGFPQDLWLGVSADAVSVYKRGEGRPLEVFQYEHILSFGAPLANTYKIVVDERELLFETSEVRGKPFVCGLDELARQHPSS